ncbi:hypothetical protein [Nocardia macrotermitis]|uniref:Phosphohydrolase n=1 Tax=Nocardia macrotermitis TaxID=2585198 RepID=A0A7K0D577_9NOCA|nr:hypothetical protein [Nocardia macrotermitis]MQY20889.1 hypothetical protein [Nocardia macrotermitis]
MSHPVIDLVLQRYSNALGPHERMYRNHVFRCYNYQHLLLRTEVPDTAALAWVVHDLGIWTAGTMDYLHPSADLADRLCSEFGIGDIDTVRTLVLDHHRIRPVADRLNETFRVADRIDLTRGWLRNDLERHQVLHIRAELPHLGFHGFLARRIPLHALRNPSHPFPMLRW